MNLRLKAKTMRPLWKAPHVLQGPVRVAVSTHLALHLSLKFRVALHACDKGVLDPLPPEVTLKFRVILRETENTRKGTWGPRAPTIKRKTR